MRTLWTVTVTLLLLLVSGPASAQFTIPDNTAGVTVSPNQSIWMQTDIDALVAGVGGRGVVSGCAVTAQGSPDMTVAVASGVVYIAGAPVTVASGNVTITAASASFPRIDIIAVDSSGVKSAIAGTPATSPGPAALPTTSVALAFVYVPTNDTTIATNQIVDKRVFLPQISGTWTPTFGGSGGQSGQAYTTQTGTYVKTGKLVTASANVVLSTLGTITGNVQIKGLPFTSASGMTGMVHVGYWASFTTGYVYIGGVVNASNTTATLYGATAAATATTTLAQANLAATSEVWVTITYLAAN